MSKNDKKLISIVLIMIMILSSILPVISNAATSQVEKDVIKDSKLKEALLEYNSYYDKNKDGNFSKEELKDLWSVNITKGVKDLTGLEYATNIESITYCWDGDLIDFTPINKENVKSLAIYVEPTANINNFDFINEFTNLESLNIMQSVNNNGEYVIETPIKISSITNCSKLRHMYVSNVNIDDISEISKLSNLKYLSLSGKHKGNQDYKDIDVAEFSKLDNLTGLSISYYNIQNIDKLKALSNLRTVSFSMVTGIKDISFIENNKDITVIYLDNTDVEDISPIYKLKGLKQAHIRNNLKISAKDIEPLIDFKEYTAYIGENVNLQNITTIRNILLGVTMDWDIVSSNEDVAKIATNGTEGIISADTKGETTITLTSKKDATVKKEFKLKVAGISANQSTGAETGTKQINYDTILRENGELVKFYIKESKAEIIDTNVNKYVYEFIYNDDYTQGFNYTFTEKKDGTIKYTFNGNEKILEDAKDFTTSGYLTKDGKYMKVTLNGKFEEITDNVENIVGSFLVKNDGKTYTITNELVCNFKITASSYDYVVDEENTVWYVGGYISSSEPIKKGENFKEFNIADNFSYINNDGAIINLDGNEKDYLKKFIFFFDYNNELILNKDNTILYNGKEILTDVISVTQYWDYDIETMESINRAVIVRKDSSIWCLTLSGEGTLKKMEEYKNSIYVEDEKLETKQIFDSETGAIKDVLTGFDTKGLTIEEAISSDKLQDGYSAKVFDKDEKEIATNKNIFTGAKIILYNEKGEAVKEYTALVYGDVTGKGSPSSRDALAIIKNKLGKVKIEDSLLLEAGRMTEKTRNNAAVPNSADALAIVKMKLGK